MNELQANASVNYELEELVLKLRENNTFNQELAKRVDYLEKIQPVNPVITSFLNTARKQHVLKILGGKSSKAYQNKKLVSEVYRSAANDFKSKFMIARYDLLRQTDQASAMNYWQNWLPNQDLLKRIRQSNA
ncbi:ORF6C domain-containing protein [Fundicoccus sp. Sow4_D5]|uniref:ORF6C domain-containing protein n=1 Tax=unclassified Fundicoccus TaxID=2761543 RepID=UPI003F8E1B3E